MYIPCGQAKPPSERIILIIFSLFGMNLVKDINLKNKNWRPTWGEFKLLKKVT